MRTRPRKASSSGKGLQVFISLRHQALRGERVSGPWIPTATVPKEGPEPRPDGQALPVFDKMRRGEEPTAEDDFEAWKSQSLLDKAGRIELGAFGEDSYFWYLATGELGDWYRWKLATGEGENDGD